MSEQIDVQPWEEACVADQLSQRQKDLADNFVREYLKDYDSFNAALRVGYSFAFAKEYGQRMLNEPYVQQELFRLENEQAEAEPEVIRKFIVSGLIKEAKTSTPASRVAAYKQLSAMHGFDAPIKTQTDVNITSPVQFYLPSNGRDPQVPEKKE